MTEIRADNVQNRVGTGKPDFDTAPTHSGGSALSTLNSLKATYTSSGTEPSSPSNGDLWWRCEYKKRGVNRTSGVHIRCECAV